jgi:hypothetical protein
MAGNVENLDPFEDYGNFSHMGRNFGNPFLNLGMGMLLGGNYMPQSHDGESAYDAFLHRERSQQYMQVQRNAFGSNAVFRSLGLKGDPTGGILGMFASSPDSMVNRLMSPMLGGNPIAAGMQLFSGLSGGATMGAFGRASAISVPETQSVLQSMANNIYRQQSLEGPGGAREEVNNKMRAFLSGNMKSEGGRAYLKQLGYAIKEGAEGEKQIAALDIVPRMQNKDQVEAITRSLTKDIGQLKDTSQLTTESDKEIQKALLGRLEKQLKEFNVASKEKIEAAVRSGNSQEIQSLVSAYEKESTKEESALSKQIRNRITVKQITSNRINEDINEISNASGAESKQRAEKKLEARLKQSGMSDEEIKALRDERGGFDRTKIKDFAKNYNSLTQDEQIYIEGHEAAHGKFRMRGFNFANSRGFKLEDFSSGFVQAADLRMLGNKQNTPIADAADDFSKNAGGAMSAARAVFGNKSMGELMKDTSDFMGSSAVDLSRKEGPGGANEIEDLLRRTKATARVAGVSIKAMLAIIKSTKDLAASNPELQHTDSSALTNLALRSAVTASAMGSQMSSRDFRAAGGGQGILADVAKENLQFQQSGLGGTGYALLGYAKSLGQDKFDYIKKKFESGKLTGRDLDKGELADIAKALGVSPARLADIASSTAMQQMGRADTEVAKTMDTVAEKSITKSFWQGAESNGIKQSKVYADFAEASKKGPVDINSFMTKYVADLGEDGRSMYTQYKRTIQKDLMDSLRGKDGREKYDQMINEQVKMDKELDEKYAGRLAPLGTQAVNAIFSGKTVKDSLHAFAGIFATDDNASKELKAVMKKAEAAGGRIADIRVKGTGSEDMLSRGMGSAINEVIDARKQEMLDRKDEVGAGKLGALSDDDLRALEGLKGFSGGAKEAKLKLEDLRTQRDQISKELEAKGLKKGSAEYQKEMTKALGGEVNAKLLSGLESAEKLGALDSDRAMQMLGDAKSGGTQAAGAAVIQGKVDQDIQDYHDKKKAGMIRNLGEKLEADDQQLGGKVAGGNVLKSAMEAYRDKKTGKVDYARMLEDFNDPGKTKDGKSNFFGDLKKRDNAAYNAFLDSGAGTQLGETQKAIDQDQVLADQQKDAAGGDPTTALNMALQENTKAMTDINGALSKVTSIASSLDTLAGAVKGIL